MAKKIKLQLNCEILNVEGKPFEDTTMAKFVANRLYSANSGDALKFLDWSTELFSTGEIEVDESDFNTILETVTSTPGISRGVLGQILRKFTTFKVV